jgi:starch synthase (maltosyl-transferring)
VVEMQFDSILLIDVAAFAAEQPVAEQYCDADNDLAIAELADACAARGLRLLLDLEIDRFAAGHELTASHHDNFFVAANQSLPDPRILPHAHHDQRAQLRLDESGIQVALDYWKARISTWLNAGVGGFRCLGIARISPLIWQDLIKHAKVNHGDADFYAWTPGCTPQQLNAVQHCAFDAVFSSDAWWNYRAGWFIEEHTRLSHIADCIIAAPEDPARACCARCMQKIRRWRNVAIAAHCRWRVRAGTAC